MESVVLNVFETKDMIAKNRQYKNLIDNQLGGLGNIRIYVGIPIGIPHASGAGGDTTVDEIATRLNFGDERIPARPFLEPALEASKDELGEILLGFAKNVLKVKNTRQADTVGVFAVGKVKEFILNSDNFKPLSEKTIARRKQKSDKPLIDTGQLINSISYTIKEVSS